MTTCELIEAVQVFRTLAAECKRTARTAKTDLVAGMQLGSASAFTIAADYLETEIDLRAIAESRTRKSAVGYSNHTS